MLQHSDIGDWSIDGGAVICLLDKQRHSAYEFMLAVAGEIEPKTGTVGVRGKTSMLDVSRSSLVDGSIV